MMKKYQIFLLFAAMSLSFTQVPKHTTNFTENPPVWEVEMLSLVNDLRGSGCRCGARYMPPQKRLVWNEKLANAARKHAADMARNRFMEHRGSDGSDFAKRAERAGYKWRFIGENIARGTREVSQTMRLWKTSPGHCKNMMQGTYTEMGAARVGDYWVQVFGSR